MHHLVLRASTEPLTTEVRGTLMLVEVTLLSGRTQEATAATALLVDGGDRKEPCTPSHRDPSGRDLNLRSPRDTTVE